MRTNRKTRKKSIKTSLKGYKKLDYTPGSKSAKHVKQAEKQKEQLKDENTKL